jgi:hypothetical protein
MPRGPFPAHGDARSVQVDLRPECSDRLGSLPDGFQATGNAYQVEATYEPGRDPVRLLHPGLQLQALLVYPALVNAHASDRALSSSPDGKVWTKLDTLDTPNLLQVQGSAPTLGYLLAGAKIQPLSPGISSSSGGVPRPWLLIAGAILLLALAFGALARSRRGKETPRR